MKDCVECSECIKVSLADTEEPMNPQDTGMCEICCCNYCTKDTCIGCQVSISQSL